MNLMPYHHIHLDRKNIKEDNKSMGKNYDYSVTNAFEMFNTGFHWYTH